MIVSVTPTEIKGKLEDVIHVITKDVHGNVLDEFELIASANDGLYTRDDPLPPKGDGAGCGTVPSYGTAGTAVKCIALGLYLLPAAFLLMVRRGIRISRRA